MQLMKREKTILVGGAGFLVVLIVLQFVVRPVGERLATLRRVVTDRREVLTQIQMKSKEYKDLDIQIARLRAKVVPQQESRRILSTIERVRQECELSQDVLSLKPTTIAVGDKYQQTMVDVRLEGVTLAQIVAFLSKLDSLVLAGRIKSLEIRSDERSPGLLRATVQLAVVTHAAVM